VLTPRKLTLMNSTTQHVIQELSFPTSVLALQINRKRCAVDLCISHRQAGESLAALLFPFLKLQGSIRFIPAARAQAPSRECFAHVSLCST